MTAPVRFPRFFVTSPAPCPYLPGKTERKVFTELKGPHAESLNDALGRIGFRRSQTVAYRPSCMGCAACVSVRVLAEEFAPSSTQRVDPRAFILRTLWVQRTVEEIWRVKLVRSSSGTVTSVAVKF